MKIETNAFRPDAPTDSLWQHYSGQQQHQPVFASLDLRDGEWTVDYSGEIGNGVPADVWHGHVLRFDLDVIPTADGANRLLTRTAAAAQRLLDAHRSRRHAPQRSAFDDSPDPCQGEIDAATAELEQALRDIPDADRIDVWDLESIWSSLDYNEITADMTDEDVSQHADALMRDLADNAGTGLAVCNGLLEHLMEERDSKRAAEAFAHG